MTNERPILLRGAHLIDPARGLDAVSDIVIKDGRILSVGEAPPDCTVVDLQGRYISPGWIDIHVHVFGGLGFADPDSIGVSQGVTTYVDAGGAGSATLPEFVALLRGQTETALYSGCYVGPVGIIGLDYIESSARSLVDIPLARYVDMINAHRDLVRYLKFGAFSNYGTGVLKLGKGLAEILGLPMYVHIGEFQNQPATASPYEIYRIATAGDMITHVYHGNGCGILDEDGKVFAVVRDAQRRGVLFDVGFGGFNFSWGVAEKAMAQDFIPDIISSDLQQFNVMGPTYSLANVMSAFLALGMTLEAIIARVTAAPARALSLADRAGALAPGMPADITVFRVEDERYQLTDTYGQDRPAERRIVPEMVFRNGKQIQCDLLRCQDERNWIYQISTDMPAAAARLTPRQLLFLERLVDELEPLDWEAGFDQEDDLIKAVELNDAFHRAHAKSGLSLKESLQALFDCFLESSFTIQVGVILKRAGRAAALQRLDAVSKQKMAELVG